MAARATVRTFRALGLAAIATGAAVAAAPPAQASAGDIARPFHARLDGAFVFGGACPPGVPAGMTCLTDHVTGTASHLGRLTGDFLVVFDFAHADADGCAPISKTGAFRTANGATLTVAASGTFCQATGAARYSYKFTGGTCRFARATGSGTWLVPPAKTFDPATGNGTGPETLDGTVRY